MTFLDNKYTRWYFAIIAKALATPEGNSKRAIKGKYTERRHIIPKALGGTNDDDNLVRLSARAHFVCHLLLVKMTEGRDRSAMQLAAFMMSKIRGTASTHERLRYAAIAHLSQRATEAHAKPEIKAKYRVSARESQNRPEVLAKHIANHADPDFKKRHAQAVSDSWIGRGFSEAQLKATRDYGKSRVGTHLKQEHKDAIGNGSLAANRHCSLCGGTGHYKHHCPTLTTPPARHCRACGEVGHRSDNCPNKHGA